MEARLGLDPSAHEREWGSDLQGRIVEVCDQQSVAEVSAAVSMPIGVVRVLLGDLVEQGYVRVQATLNDSSSVTSDWISSKGPSVDSARSNAGSRAAASTKIVVAGGFGVGKTTLVGSVSEIKPLRTEALVTNESEGVDDLDAVPSKATTTVAMDFGRITLAEDLVLYLFGTPGQRRFWFMWDDLCRGAIGAIVLVDTARLNEAFSPLDYFEAKGIPFIVARQRVRGQPEVPARRRSARRSRCPTRCR